MFFYQQKQIVIYKYEKVTSGLFILRRIFQKYTIIVLRNYQEIWQLNGQLPICFSKFGQ